MKLQSLALTSALVLALLAAGCSAPRDLAATPDPGTAVTAETQAPVATPPPATPTPDPNLTVEELALTVSSAAELAQTAAYPNLRKLDLTGSGLSSREIAEWAAQHPELQVIWQVPLAGRMIDSDAASLKLAPGEYDYDSLIEALSALPAVAALELPETTLNADQLAMLRETYALDYTFTFLGETYGPETAELDLSALTEEELAEAVGALRMFSHVGVIYLMDENGGCPLSREQVLSVMDAAPATAAVHYVFELFGQTVSSLDERVEFEDVSIGDENEPQIREALDLLRGCTYFKLDKCGVSSPVMASIRDDYPDKKIVWRIYCGPFHALTDDEVILMTFELNDNNCSELQYCTDVKYMDIGHNDTLTDISYVQYMPDLECIIVSGAPVSDISYFANCDKLEWLELCFCYWITDISVMEEMDALRFVNISNSQVSDISALYDKDLERFCCMNAKVPAAAQNEFISKHPDCITQFYGTQPYGYGWRYNDAGYTFFDYYAKMRDVFHYPDPGWYGGWKMSDVVFTT